MIVRKLLVTEGRLRRQNVLDLTWPMIRPDVDRGRLVGGELHLPGSVVKSKHDLVLPLTGGLLDVFARPWVVVP